MRTDRDLGEAKAEADRAEEAAQARSLLKQPGGGKPVGFHRNWSWA